MLRFGECSCERCIRHDVPLARDEREIENYVPPIKKMFADEQEERYKVLSDPLAARTGPKNTTAFIAPNPNPAAIDEDTSFIGNTRNGLSGASMSFFAALSNVMYLGRAKSQGT